MTDGAEQDRIGHLVIVTNIASPYRLSTWNAIAQRTKATRVLLCAESEANRMWRTDELESQSFSAEILPGRAWHIRRRGWTFHWNPSILRRLSELRPTHLLVTGFNVPTLVASLLWARARRVPCALWTGSHSDSYTVGGKVARWARRRLLALPHAYLTYGTAATRTLTEEGIPGSAIVTGINSVDVDSIARSVEREQAAAAEHRSRDARMQFLYVGQLIERKGVRELVQAFSTLPSERAVLSIVGYGSIEAELRSFVRERGLTNVIFEGATRSIDETVRFYARANVLVMPSLSEVWGLVVNEALAAGVFVVASATAGVAEDLIDGAPLSCGISYDPRDTGALEVSLRRALDESGTGDRAAIASWGRSFTPERYADAAIRALSLAEQRIRR